MKDMHKLKDMLCRELEELGEKGKLSAGDIDTIYKLASSLKNIGKIEMDEGEGGYSQRGGGWRAEGEYDDEYDRMSSGTRRGRHYVRAHYSRDGGNYDGNSYDGGFSMRGSSYDEGLYSRRGYSRDGGKEEMIGIIDDMMERAETEKQREALKRCRAELSRG